MTTEEQLAAAERLLRTMYKEMSGNSNYVEKRMIEDYFERKGERPEEVTS